MANGGASRTTRPHRRIDSGADVLSPEQVIQLRQYRNSLSRPDWPLTPTATKPKLIGLALDEAKLLRAILSAARPDPDRDIKIGYVFAGNLIRG